MIMKVTVFTSDIKKALSDLAHFAVTGKSAIRELKGVLIKTGKGNITVSCTDLKSCLKVTIEAIIVDAWEVVVDFETLSNIVKNCETTRVSLELVDGKLAIDGFKIPTIDPSDYPDIDTAVSDDLPEAIVDSHHLKLGLVRVEHSSAGKNGTIQGFYGARLTAGNNAVIFAAQDGWRLSETTKPATTTSEFGFRLDGKHAKALAKILPNKSESVTIVRNGNKILITWSGHVAMFVESEGNFLDYEGFFPDENHEQIVVNRKDLIAKIRKAGVLVSATTYKIKLSASKSGLEVSAYTESADMQAQVKTIDNSMDNKSVHLNGQYLLDTLAALTSDNVVLFWEQEEHPVYVFSQGEYETDRDVIMSLRM